MDFTTVFIIAVGLSMDAFAVAVAVSMRLGRVTGRQVFRFSFHFGLFQAMMPVIGWFAGRGLGGWFVAWDHWIAFALLAGIGCRAIREGLSKEEECGPSDGPVKDATRGMSLVMFSVATSIDALAVGLSLAVLRVDIWYPVTIIGVTTGALTILGMRLGSRIGARFGHWTETGGGLILIGIGLKILVEGLLG